MTVRPHARRAADRDDLAELTPAFTIVGGRAVHDPDGVPLS